MSPTAARSPGPATAYAVFRPRRGAWVAGTSAIALLAVFVVLAVLLPQEGVSGWGLADRVVLVGFGMLISGFLWRYTRIRAMPSPQGLRVVNLISSRDLEWAQIVRVGFSGGTPWVVLELTDTDELSVMAIQRADGPHGTREAGRLAALVEHHSRPTVPPG